MFGWEFGVAAAMPRGLDGEYFVARVAGRSVTASGQAPPGTWEADYRRFAVDGDVAVAISSTTYAIEPGGPVDWVYDDCFVLRFGADGRCRDSTEWYVKRPRRG